MKRILTGFWEVLKREAGLIIKDKDLVTIILLSPLFYAIFYTSIYTNKTEQKVPVVIVDMDRSNSSKAFIRELDAHQMINVKEVVPDYASGIDRVYKLEAQGVVYIPQGFEGSLKSAKGTDLKIYLNTSRFLVSNDINKAINEVAGTLSAGVRIRYFQAQGFSFEQAMEISEPLQNEVKPLFNVTESYGDFLIPGLLVLILQQTLLIGLSESVAKEREEGSLSGLYTAAKRSLTGTISGKGAFYFLLYASYALLFYTLHFSIFKISFKGSVSAAAVMTAIFLVAVICMAMLISSFFKRKIISLQVLVFTSYPVFLMSGYPWPFQAMPGFIVVLGGLLPSTPYLNAFNRIIQMGAGWQDIMPEFVHLSLLALAFFAITYLRFRNLFKKEIKEPEAQPGLSVS
ncbi:MAG: ABC transporter permease [Ignavibacteria bacterium]|jgi:ABC-2 type transport system permease protein|nr:ABC transporter permease [Ignavibacteria bacterium]MCU7504007.1 ABC transporter permease [Ignavibacteria bacterium]MCU7515379.1 ABC transporter permease [Ignavibacteria bacterium]